MAKQSNLTYQLISLTVILITILLSIFVFDQFISFQSLANLNQPKFASPYLRLSEIKKDLISKSFTVDIALNTNNIKTVATDISIEYDPSLVKPKLDELKSLKAYKVLHLSDSEPGNLKFSLFNSPIDDQEQSVYTAANEELGIARVSFEILDETASGVQLKLPLKEGKNNQNFLLTSTDSRQTNPPNILQSTQGIFVKF